MRPLVEKTPFEGKEEFEAVVQPYMQELRKYCLSLEKSLWDGEDLMQETLMKAYKSWSKRPKPMAKAYLFRIASNTWIDRYRKCGIEEDMNRDLSEFKQEDEAISDAAIEAVEVLLDKLSPKQRVVMLLMEGFGYTAQEAANMIGESEGSVKAALHRARKKLKPIRRDSLELDSEKDETLPYIAALRNGDSAGFVRLYQKETQQPQMSVVSSRTDATPVPAVPSIAGGGTSYVLVSIPMRNGETLFVPFYQLELSILLSRLEGIRREFSIAA
ncbi:MAG TPA: RNA polymerase sigma factor [Bacillales bacterium]|nr:RNA polymerase sigma factor [Bacillales bacterium]HEU5141251.1 RNA polymerase sigma factor [Bacillales bacterium]